MIAYSYLFTLLVIEASVFSQMFSAPPYALDLQSIGVIAGIGPLIAALIGGLSTRYVSMLSVCQI